VYCGTLPAQLEKVAKGSGMENEADIPKLDLINKHYYYHKVPLLP
jgi:hypothetical protein